jgi:hypothetical protein
VVASVSPVAVVLVALVVFSVIGFPVMALVLWALWEALNGRRWL